MKDSYNRNIWLRGWLTLWKIDYIAKEYCSILRACMIKYILYSLKNNKTKTIRLKLMLHSVPFILNLVRLIRNSKTALCVWGHRIKILILEQNVHNDVKLSLFIYLFFSLVQSLFYGDEILATVCVEPVLSGDSRQLNFRLLWAVFFGTYGDSREESGLFYSDDSK